MNRFATRRVTVADAWVADACPACLRRAWLLAALSGRLDTARARILDVLVLGDEELMHALGVPSPAELAAPAALPSPDALPAVAGAAGLSVVCRCAARYPRRLLELAAPPAVLYLAGEPDALHAALAGDVVAIVGARRATQYGAGVAAGLGDALARTGVTVVSGMALGIDGAAHAGALGGAGPSAPQLDEDVLAGTVAPDPPGSRAPTVAVLPGPPSDPYPASHRGLCARIVASGGAVSELPPGTPVRRWMFPARNRIIAGLATMTVVVEASERSGSLVTARVAGELGRCVGAVPGKVTSRAARGTNALLAGGARVVRGPEDVLEALFGPDRTRLGALEPPPLPAHLQALLDALSDGEDTTQAIATAGLDPSAGVAGLAELELAGRLRRAAGGFAVVR